MYGFCRNTDLGISHFNFSSKNYSSKVYTCFAKVVGLVTRSTEKLGLQYLDFSTILYVFYKLQLKHNKGKETFAGRPLESFKPSQICPWLEQNTLKFLGSRNVALGGLGRRGSPDSGEAGGRDGRGRVGEEPRGHVRPIWGRSLGQAASVRGARQRLAVSAAGARATVRGRRGRGNQ
jgi:hypothetical protein